MVLSNQNGCDKDSFRKIVLSSGRADTQEAVHRPLPLQDEDEDEGNIEQIYADDE